MEQSNTTPRFAALPNGALVDMWNISCIVGGLNEWIVVAREQVALGDGRNSQQIGVKMDGLTKDGLVAKMLEIGLAVTVRRAETEETKAGPKIATA